MITDIYFKNIIRNYNSMDDSINYHAWFKVEIIIVNNYGLLIDYITDKIDEMEVFYKKKTGMR